MTTAPAASATRTTGVGVSCRGLVYIYRLEGYDVVALAGVDLDIEPSESVALLGPSGSGKSTLLAVLAGLLPPSAGRLLVGDRDMTKASDIELAQMRANNVGVVLQGTSRNLLPYLSAEQNVRFAQRGGSGRRDSPSPREVLQLVGLSGRGRGRMRPHELTPGERQRLALAVALANGPGLLLADEPTSQLDSRARDEVISALESVRQAGTTVVLVTHDPTVGAQMGRTITIRDGRVGAEGRKGEDYAVVGRDGSIHLPPDVLQAFPPGTLVEVLLVGDGTARLAAAGDPSVAALRRAAPAVAPTHGVSTPALPSQPVGYAAPQYADARYADQQYADQQYAETPYQDPRYGDGQFGDSQYTDAQRAQAQRAESQRAADAAGSGQRGSGLAEALRRDPSSTAGFDYWGEPDTGERR